MILERIDATKTSTAYVTLGELSPLVGKTFTLSLDNDCKYKLAIAIVGGAHGAPSIGTPSYIGTRVKGNGRLKLTCTVPKISEATELRFLIQTTNNSDITETSYRISNIQFEVGTEATEYEEYKEPERYIVNADGVVEGVTAIYPSTTLMAETQGTTIRCQYNKDINKAFEKVVNAIVSSGGDV